MVKKTTKLPQFLKINHIKPPQRNAEETRVTLLRADTINIKSQGLEILFIVNISTIKNHFVF